jgi:hypothetical protein
MPGSNAEMLDLRARLLYTLLMCIHSLAAGAGAVRLRPESATIQSGSSSATRAASSSTFDVKSDVIL